MANWLTFEQVAQVAEQAGWRGEALVTAVAIAAAESGGTHRGQFMMDAEALGDVQLTQKDERSVGLWQINYRPLRDKGNPTRNPNANLDPATNARNAYTISSAGTKWTPWSTYTSGRYRAHLDAARQATGGAPGGAPSGDPGRPISLHRPLGPGLPIRLGGLAGAGELGDLVVGGSVELTTDEVSELVLEIQAPGLKLLGDKRITIGTAIDYQDLRFEVVALEVRQGQAQPHLVLTCHPSGAVAMRDPDLPPKPANDLSPTQYMQLLAKAAGLAFRGESAAKRPNIGPVKVQPQTPGDRARLETGWEVGQRLAQELGYLAFESGGTYHFGSPTFLNTSGRSRHVVWLGRRTFAGATSGEPIDLIDLPTCRASTVHIAGGKRLLRDVTIEGRVPRADGETLRPGNNLLLSGVPIFEGGGRMITRVAWPLHDLHSPVEFTAESVQRLAASGRTDDDDLAGGGAVASPGTSVLDRAAGAGTASALDFVTYCLQQAGDSYVFGAETRLDDPDPDAFDCSELIQWAAAQVGVDFVDGSANQIAAATPISLHDAYRTRGALVYQPGHIAVSLGDGRRTIEARGRKYGVLEVDGINRRGWTRAGLIPGLRYQ